MLEDIKVKYRQSVCATKIQNSIIKHLYKNIFIKVLIKSKKFKPVLFKVLLNEGD